MSKPIKIIIISFGILFVLLIMFSLTMASFVMTGNRQTYEEALSWQSEHYDTSFYEDIEKNDYIVSGFEGYELHTELLKNSNNTGNYIILSHGYTDNMIGSLKYVQMYLDLGFNCIIYDLRGHGANEKTFTSYGLLESNDLISLINDTRNRYDDLKVLGLHGESLGAATTLTSLKYAPEVEFVVADCGFSDIQNVLQNGYRSVGIPDVLFNIADLGARLRYHYALTEMRPIDSLTNNTIPILFMHGADDNFILPKNSEDMYERTKGIKEIHLIPNAGHAESVLTDPDNYKKYVADYLNLL